MTGCIFKVVESIKFRFSVLNSIAEHKGMGLGQVHASWILDDRRKMVMGDGDLAKVLDAD